VGCGVCAWGLGAGGLRLDNEAKNNDIKRFLQKKHVNVENVLQNTKKNQKPEKKKPKPQNFFH
jgi:hypothetical protein